MGIPWDTSFILTGDSGILLSHPARERIPGKIALRGDFSWKRSIFQGKLIFLVIFDQNGSKIGHFGGK